jgi:transcription antitermination factor NusA-like protein
LIQHQHLGHRRERPPQQQQQQKGQREKKVGNEIKPENIAAIKKKERPEE